MRRSSVFFFTAFLCLLLICTTAGGLLATWHFAGGPPDDVVSGVDCLLSDFRYGALYITNISVVGGIYDNAQPSWVSDLNMQADIDLSPQINSSVIMEVTFYNNTNNSFYYNKTENRVNKFYFAS